MKLCNNGHCTCFFDKVGKYVLAPCCKLHDFNYDKQHIRRSVADGRFKKCLKKHSFFLLAFLMWVGVRTFGWYFWKKARNEKVTKKKSNAIIYKEKLAEHFSDQTNHYLYKLKDDGTLVAWMCCDFEIVDGHEVILRGGCGDGICYDLENKNITIEKG